MKKLMRVFLITLFIFPFFLYGGIKVNAADLKNIIILNSYNAGFPWTDEQVQGISDTLATYDGDYRLSIEYLDWKRYPTEQTLETAYDSFSAKYSDQIVDLIICTDDAALEFAFTNRVALFSGAPIVFSGVNEAGLAKIDSGQKNFTGIYEELNPEETIQAALEINPSLDTIYLIYDNTESGISTGYLCRMAAMEVDYTLKVVSMNKYTSKEIIQILSNADENSMILLTTYFSDIDGTEIDHQQFCEDLYSVSPAPIYHLYDFGLNHGALGGSIILSSYQGEIAGELAIRILNGEDPDQIPVVDQMNTQFIFDYELMKQYKINLKDLPQGSQLINSPFEFFETYKNLAISILIIFVLLVIILVSLIFYANRIKEMRNKLMENNEELSSLYEGLTASEEELRAQYDEITESHELLGQYSDKLQHLAYHDNLTELYNRLYLYETLQVELNSDDPQGALFFIDLDNFKFVNDTLGHSVGDALLVEISHRLMELRDDNYFLIRLGGDEFIFLRNVATSIAEAKDFADKLITSFSTPFYISDNNITVSVSIGISIYPQNGNNIDTLLKNADMAMYKVKDLGKNGYAFFDDLIEEELLYRLQIENSFQRALEENEFVLYYQPQTIPETGETDGFEALVRWDNKELGFLSPLVFIPIAEENGFIRYLGNWILKEACNYIKELNERFHKKYKISVNISIIQLLQDDFIEITQTILRESGLSPELLELEITESVIADSPEIVSEKIKTLRKIGVRTALDDFGTGYSSLSYLKHLPITTLKIDKIFIDDINNYKSNTDVTDAIISLGHKLNLTIVAEGVETQVQIEYLKKHGCDKIQGYYYSKPLPQEELEIYLKKEYGFLNSLIV